MTISALMSPWYVNMGSHTSNLFIYQARVQPGPSRVSDSPVSAETLIYEAFVLIWEIGEGFSLLISWSKGNV